MLLIPLPGREHLKDVIMLSQTVEYALRAMVYLAARPGESHKTREIARTTQVPPSYLPKILQSLAKAGLVASQRGLRGGAVLTRDPGEISLLDVVDAVDPIRRIDTCPLSLKSHEKGLCPLHRRLDEVYAATREAFAATALDELLRDESGCEPFLEEFLSGTESATP